MVITYRASSLCYVFHSALMRIVLYCHQMGRKHPNPMIPPSWYPATRAFLRESALPVFSEELLPDAVSQNIFMIVTDIDINCIITICTADFSTHGRFITLGCWRKYHISALLPARRVQWMRLCWPAPMPIACPSLHNKQNYFVYILR